MTSTHYDAIVIGSGQGGNPLAMAFEKAGKHTAMIEATHIGGCCVNEGCTPTKTMISSGRVAYLTRRSKDYGVHHGNTVTVDMTKVRERKRNIVDSFRSGGEKRLGDSGVDVLMGKASFLAEKKIQVKLNDGSERICEADIIVINAGERPVVPNLEGLETVKQAVPEAILDSTSIQELGILPKSLLVVGGGYIGLEFGQLFSRLGSNVTIIQRGSRLLPREDPEITESLRKILEEDGMKILTDTVPLKISASSDKEITLNVKSSGNVTSLKGTHILFAAGRTPNTDLLNISAGKIETNNRGYILTNDTLATNIPGIYAMGDIRGPPAFTHISYDDFRILRDALELSPVTDQKVFHTVAARERFIPYCMFTDPQLAHVGIHLHSLPAESKKGLKVASMPMSYVARALETDESRGMMKAVVDGESGLILGFTVLGLEGGELMSVVQMAMMGGLKWWDLREAVFAHPTIAECLNNLWGFLEDVK